MTVAEQAGTATISRLACRYALAGGGADQAALRWRLDQVLRGRLADALAAALEPLGDADRGAVWVVRGLRADAVVSATLDDLDRLARQWGAQLADAILAVLRAGPGGNVVRFASRAQYLAAFAAALAARSAENWVFEPLAGLRLLSPTSAIRSGAVGAGLSVAEVFAELVGQRQLDTVLSAATATEKSALWAACVAEASAQPLIAGHVARVRALAAESLEGAMLAGSRGDTALTLFALAIPALGAGPEIVLAVDAVAASAGATSVAQRGLAAADAAAHAEGAAGGMAVAEDGAQVSWEPSELDRRTAGQADVFAARGGQAFMLLPSLERVGLEAVSSATRARVITKGLRLDPDAAILLAAGASVGADEVDGAAALEAVHRALAADDRIDGRRLVAEAVTHPDGRRRIALVRDAGSDIWLAGAVRARRGQLPWTALVETAIAVGGREPEAILGVTSGTDLSPECAATVTRLRPAAADIAWLEPVDDDDLAAGLAARAVLRDLARRLLGFGRSSIPYLVERFLPAGGIIAVGGERIGIELPAAPLAVILVMAGLDTVSYHVPWLEQDVLITHRGA